MKKIIIFIFVLIVTLNCKNYLNKEIQTEANNKTNSISENSDTPKEIFYWVDAKLNGISLQTNKTILKKELGDFDSIIIDYDNCYGVFQDEYEIAFIKKSRFQLSGDSIIAESIYLKDNITLSYNNKCLTNKTTLNEFSQIFPLGYKNKIIVNNDDFGLGDNLTLIKIKESENDIDFVIHFLFKENKLFLVARWYPC